jgi:hypothetical protein
MHAGKRADVKRRDVDKAASAARASALRKLKVRRTLAFHILFGFQTRIFEKYVI